MAVLLPVEELQIVDLRGALDSHGWATEDPGAATLIWEGMGNLQEAPPVFDPLAADGGGEGPSAPVHKRVGVAYLPSTVAVEAGMQMVARGLSWWVQRVVPVPDPVGMGSDCVMLEVSQRVIADEPT